MVQTYRERLRVEGAVLAGSGAIASALLATGADGATDHAASTAIQLAGVTIGLTALGPWAVRRWMARAQPVAGDMTLTGEPTALWKPPLVVVVLAGAVVAAIELGAQRNGWDAGLRVTLGCLLVGVAQALLLERVVAADEGRSSRRYVRVRGSGATKLGFLPAGPQ